MAAAGRSARHAHGVHDRGFDLPFDVRDAARSSRFRKLHRPAAPPSRRPAAVVSEPLSAPSSGGGANIL